MPRHPADIRECFYCRRRLTRKNKTRDHVQPRSRNGSDKPHNVVEACKTCNCLKGCLTLEEFRLVIAYRQGRIKKARMLFPGEIKRILAERD